MCCYTNSGLGHEAEGLLLIHGIKHTYCWPISMNRFAAPTNESKLLLTDNSYHAWFEGCIQIESQCRIIRHAVLPTCHAHLDGAPWTVAELQPAIQLVAMVGVTRDLQNAEDCLDGVMTTFSGLLVVKLVKRKPPQWWLFCTSAVHIWRASAQHHRIIIGHTRHSNSVITCGWCCNTSVPNGKHNKVCLFSGIKHRWSLWHICQGPSHTYGCPSIHVAKGGKINRTQGNHCQAQTSEPLQSFPMEKHRALERMTRA